MGENEVIDEDRAVMSKFLGRLHCFGVVCEGIERNKRIYEDYIRGADPLLLWDKVKLYYFSFRFTILLPEYTLIFSSITSAFSVLSF